jgi:hypothetical protein
VYQLTLPDKYAWLHPVFPIQFLEDYHHHHNNAKLMAMLDLKEPQDDWKVEEVQDKQQIKDVIHYLVKWAGWPSKYNFYKALAELTAGISLADGTMDSCLLAVSGVSSHTNLLMW